MRQSVVKILKKIVHFTTAIFTPYYFFFIKESYIEYNNHAKIRVKCQLIEYIVRIVVGSLLK